MKEEVIKVATQKRYIIDFDKVKTVDDIKSILKGLDISVSIINNAPPENIKEVLDRGLLKEINK